MQQHVEARLWRKGGWRRGGERRGGERRGGERRWMSAGGSSEVLVGGLVVHMLHKNILHVHIHIQTCSIWSSIIHIELSLWA